MIVKNNGRTITDVVIVPREIAGADYLLSQHTDEVIEGCTRTGVFLRGDTRVIHIRRGKTSLDITVEKGMDDRGYNRRISVTGGDRTEKCAVLNAVIRHYESAADFEREYWERMKNG